MDRQMVVRVDGEASDAWRRMLDAVVRDGFSVAVVTGRPDDGVGQRFEGVLLEVEEAWLRVQPVDADGLPCAATEYVATGGVDHVQVYGRSSGEWLNAVGFAAAEAM